MWILKNYESVEKLTTARNKMVKHFDEWINEQIATAIKKVSIDYNITPKETYNCIVFDKEEWPKGKGSFSWDRFSLAIWSTDYNSLADGSCQVLPGALFHLGTKVDKAEFDSLFKKHFKGRDISSDAYSCWYAVDFPSIDQICVLLEQNKENELQAKIDTIISELADLSSTVEDFIEKKKLKA